MNNNFQKIISIIIISISFFACSKHTHSTTTDATKPIITVAEPTANDTLSLAVEQRYMLNLQRLTNQVCTNSMYWLLKIAPIPC